ncbi:MAG: hypothetical protein HY934_06170 [Candidatus Firestonebacteria bacterium]|nr:hypothetical protein [Candidatus Firestonebacteria bacterium]
MITEIINDIKKVEEECINQVESKREKSQLKIKTVQNQSKKHIEQNIHEIVRQYEGQLIDEKEIIANELVQRKIKADKERQELNQKIKPYMEEAVSLIMSKVLN